MGLLTELTSKQVVVLGLGLTGLACVRFLHAQGLSFTVNDSRAMPFATPELRDEFLTNHPNANLVVGHWHKKLISAADVVIVSPGIDLVATGISEMVRADCQVIGDVELFCQINNHQLTPIDLLAVTGSNGKSTVVSLLAYLAKALGIHAGLGGNIGHPVLDFLRLEQAGDVQAANQVDLLIVELSSFQLETLTSMKAIVASVLNISDDHLDRHKTLTHYQNIKQSIYRQSNIAVVNRDDHATGTPVAEQKVISFGSDPASKDHFGLDTVNNQRQLMFGEQALIPLKQLPLAGLHNALNYLSALALGYSVGWPVKAMVENLAGFSGLAHRCQRIQSSDEIQWINDSKATNVGATLAAISGLSATIDDNAKLILIAGGEGKGADFSPLKELLNNAVSAVITLGKDGDEIAALVPHSYKVSSMKAALETANKLAASGDMVLLSPACASIDMFKNFSERGEQFIHGVAQLQRQNSVEGEL
jgi:UDP-N-acetylmuramoylalanine--D-glutamate ligase